jgi:hypothetical protein
LFFSDTENKKTPAESISQGVYNAKPKIGGRQGIENGNGTVFRIPSRAEPAASQDQQAGILLQER